MSEKSVFHLISDITREEGVPCVLIGGFAVNYYRVTRQTSDIDLLMTKDDFTKIASILEKAGYKKAVLQENFAQLESGKVSLMDVDLMFVDRQTLENILNEGEKMHIAGQEFVVPSLFHLIALKLHSIKHNEKLRLLKDFPDIVNLIRINKVNIDTPEFKEMCLKYGTQSLLLRIQEAL